MKIKSYFLPIILLAIANSGCSNVKKTLASGDCSFTYKDSSFEKNLYPFNIEKYYTSNLIHHFKENTKIDSSISKYGNTVFRNYKFSDHKSTFTFSQLRNSNKKESFSIFFTVKSEMITFNKGIKFGMQRKAFFDALNIDELNCDTVNFKPKGKGYFYRIVFDNDSIASISTEIIAM